MVNAHPKVLLAVAKIYGKELPYLRKYVKDRGKYLSQLMSAYGCCKKVAKILGLILFNGGSCDTWYRDNHDFLKNKKAMMPIFFRDMQKMSNRFGKI